MSPVAMDGEKNPPPMTGKLPPSKARYRPDSTTILAVSAYLGSLENIIRFSPRSPSRALPYAGYKQLSTMFELLFCGLYTVSVPKYTKRIIRL